MRKFNLFVVIAFSACTQFALAQNKETKEYIKENITPGITKAESAFKTACGCNVKVSYDTKIKDMDSIRGAVSNPLSKIPDAVTAYCSNKASKDAVCKMKELYFDMQKANGATFKSGKATLSSDGTGHLEFDSLTKLLDI